MIGSMNGAAPSQAQSALLPRTYGEVVAGVIHVSAGTGICFDPVRPSRYLTSLGRVCPLEPLAEFDVRRLI